MRKCLPAAISHQRSQIIAGDYVNLVKILLVPELSDGHVVDWCDVSVMLKDNDPQLSKTLTLAEFIVAFGVYRDVICKVIYIFSHYRRLSSHIWRNCLL